MFNRKLVLVHLGLKKKDFDAVHLNLSKLMTKFLKQSFTLAEIPTENCGFVFLGFHLFITT